MEDRIFLVESIIIFDRLISKCHSTETGIFWKTISYSGRSEESTEIIREDIYSGNAGIILYIIELYNVVREERIGIVANRSIDWLIDYCDTNPLTSYSFYSGRSGVAYVLLKAGHIFENKKYVDAAIRYLKQSNEAFRENRLDGIDDLINGAAGLLLANLHMYAFIKSKDYLEEILFITDHLISRINYGAKGMYWDRVENHISGLCGFSHGVSGLAWIFAELSSFFGDDFFLGIAQQAIYYEDIFFDREKGNWADLRIETNKKMLTESNIDKYRSAIGSPSDGLRFMNAWCHGAPGIGLARDRIYELSRSRKVLNKARIAVESTVIFCDHMLKANPSFTLCHGIGGNAYLLLKYFRKTNDPILLNKIRGYGVGAIEQNRKMGYYISGYGTTHKETLDLFTGIAGIGYFYLQCFNRFNSQLDILQPIPNVKYGGKLPYNEKNKKVLKTIFPRVISLMQKDTDFESIQIDYFSRGFKKKLIESMQMLVELTPHKEILLDILAYEGKVSEYDSRAINNHALRVFKYIQRKTLNNLHKAELDMNTVLEFSSTCLLIKNKFYWFALDISKPFDLNEEQNYIVLDQTYLGANEIQVNILEGAICKLLNKEMSIGEVIDRIKLAYSLPEEEGDFTQIINNMIFSLVKQGILTIK